jgi:hypothetical protein
MGGDEFNVMKDRMHASFLDMPDFNYAIGDDPRALEGEGKAAAV